MELSYYKDIYELLCKRHPNSRIYIISDHHFYHSNIIQYQRPEFDNIIEMNEYIIKCHNSVVESDDIVIFLGDFCFKKSLRKDLLKQLNGYKYLLLGNHDDEDLKRCYGNLGFEGVFTNAVKINNDFLSHYPLRPNEFDNLNFNLLIKEFNQSKGINYHGHLHTEDIGKKPFINVCCEAQNYKPVLIGHTENLEPTTDKPLLINSNHFEDILCYLKETKSLPPSLVISDYIYSLLLEATNLYADSSFVYGSFPLYKKYGFVSNFSDLDVCLVYNENMSKLKNYALLKKLFSTAFENAKSIDNINLSFDKIIDNMRIFEFLYSDKSGNAYRGYYDTNVVLLDTSRDTDFMTNDGCTILEKVLKHETNLLSDFKLPRYKSRFLTIDGDIANISLQLLFQQNLGKKESIALKKLRYIYRNHGNKDIANVNNLDDVMVRFFIRNILFFHKAKRSSEIEYIKSGYKNLEKFMNDIPTDLRLQMDEILRNPKSLFNTVYSEISKVSLIEIHQKSKELIKAIK